MTKGREIYMLLCLWRPKWWRSSPSASMAHSEMQSPAAPRRMSELRSCPETLSLGVSFAEGLFPGVFHLQTSAERAETQENRYEKETVARIEELTVKTAS